jgi:hypothetical protein
MKHTLASLQHILKGHLPNKPKLSHVTETCDVCRLGEAVAEAERLASMLAESEARFGVARRLLAGFHAAASAGSPPDSVLLKNAEVFLWPDAAVESEGTERDD